MNKNKKIKANNKKSASETKRKIERICATFTSMLRWFNGPFCRKILTLNNSPKCSIFYFILYICIFLLFFFFCFVRLMLLFFKLCHLFIPFPFFHPFLCVLYLVYWVNFTRMSSKWGKCDACNNDYTVRTSIYWQTVRYTMNCIICNGNTCMFCVHFRSSVTMHFKFICSVKSFFPLYFSRVLHLFRVFSFLFFVFKSHYNTCAIQFYMHKSSF